MDLLSFVKHGQLESSCKEVERIAIDKCRFTNDVRDVLFAVPLLQIYADSRTHRTAGSSSSDGYVLPYATSPFTMSPESSSNTETSHFTLQHGFVSRQDLSLLSPSPSVHEQSTQQGSVPQQLRPQEQNEGSTSQPQKPHFPQSFGNHYPETGSLPSLPAEVQASVGVSDLRALDFTSIFDDMLTGGEIKRKGHQ